MTITNVQASRRTGRYRILGAACAGMVAAALIAAMAIGPAAGAADEADSGMVTKAHIDGTGPGWQELTLDDFTNVNCYDDTWEQREDVIYCTGDPIGVIRSKETITNFELVLNWRHLKPAGNSGVFVWVPEESLEELEPGSLPHGIENQILDHGYKERYEESGRTGDWFSTNGDVFAVGESKMDPFPPLSPNGSRSFPSKNLSKGAGEWNHYYIRAINGEVRLWVNGEEVSGGTNCDPATGYLCLESEGSPIEFKNLRIRELP